MGFQRVKPTLSASIIVEETEFFRYSDQEMSGRTGTGASAEVRKRLIEKTLSVLLMAGPS